MISRLKSLFTDTETPVAGPESEEQKQFCNSWLEQHNRMIAFLGFSVGFIYHAVSLITDHFMIVQDDIRAMMANFHFAYLALVPIFVITSVYFRRALTTFVILAQFITVLGYVNIFIDQAFLSTAISLPLVKSYCAFLIVSIFLVLLCPFNNLFVPIYAAMFVGISAFAWSYVPDSNSMIGVTCFALVVATIFKSSQSRRSREEAVREFQARKKLEDIQRTAYQQQMQVARKIQDSIAPPTNYVSGALSATFFHSKHEAVGGDWIAVRKNSTGELVVVVADASGKGVQAALVVHAVQALWAEALGYDAFKPEIWLRRVNEALYRLGQRSPHALTMGILVIGSEQAQYWCAGHLPVFSVDNDNSKVELMLGRGPILGINLEAHFAPATISLGQERRMLLLGTDGVFAKGTSHKRAEILKVHDTLLLGGDALSCLAPDIHDDRTLVWIDYNQDRITKKDGVALVS